MFNFVVSFWRWRGLGSDVACLFCFYSYIAVHVCHVNACLCPDFLCCVASSASLSPLEFQVSRREVFAAVVTFFCLLVTFCLWCHICYLVGCFQSVCFDSLHQQQAFHNAVWLWVMLYKIFRWSPGRRFAAGFKLLYCMARSHSGRSRESAGHM